QTNNIYKTMDDGRESIEVLPTEHEIEEKKNGKRQKQKVPLQPGHSQLDWMRIQSGRHMSQQARHGQIFSIEELKKHNRPDDAWTVYKGRVYDITSYFSYHPGGDVQLARAAGKDCTKMFEFRHGWVNFEAMMDKLFIGYLE
ncbi:hypothetical protein SAMD00019534_125950, partial [Acytostelium subglobosum LB1]|uniref:hypothetical protein n=1 Tax=Acytostelium subglobosum LB1 TaxID=1410327 RepID=UPI000644BE57